MGGCTGSPDAGRGVVRLQQQRLNRLHRLIRQAYSHYYTSRCFIEAGFFFKIDHMTCLGLQIFIEKKEMCPHQQRIQAESVDTTDHTYICVLQCIICTYIITIVCLSGWRKHCCGNYPAVYPSIKVYYQPCTVCSRCNTSSTFLVVTVRACAIQCNKNKYQNKLLIK